MFHQISVTLLAIMVVLIQTLVAEPTLPMATCDSEKCILPDCLCMSTMPPLGLKPEEIPQMVFLTFDDAVADVMYSTYQKIFHNRTNPNGCNIVMTFYVTHEGTNYRLVNELYNRGNEMASHTVSHKMNYHYWTNTSVEFWQREAGYQRYFLHTYGNIPLNKIQGFRAPFLQTGGDATQSALRRLGMTFDSSYTTIQLMDPPIWPFTMDYGLTHECIIPSCSKDKHPGFWTIPMIEFRNGENGALCKMADTCFPPYLTRPHFANQTTKEVFDYFMFNFKRFNKTRAPFSINQHMYWFLLENQAILEGFLQFLDYLASLDYVYIVPISKGIEWLKNPKTLAEMQTKNVFSCDSTSANMAPCPKPQVCYYTTSIPGGARLMGSCNSCPAEYPWLLDHDDDLIMQSTSTKQETTSTTTQALPMTMQTTSATGSATHLGYQLVINVILVIQGFVVSFCHFFC
ncbi:chitin deacetylase 8-like [Daphnia carinata]|uniref:chitin deacetylase 8-like n=1 Tax=Daphnia carinata TaxID=120202 RepID=UPI0025804E53|nr:chitin deacetylase 8-like [Daphnia carinata]